MYLQYSFTGTVGSKYAQKVTAIMIKQEVE